MSQAERIDLLGKMVPEFREGLDMMRRTALKYNTLTNRLSTTSTKTHQPTALAILGAKIREQLKSDKFAKKIHITDDIVVSRQGTAGFVKADTALTTQTVTGEGP